MAQQLFTTQRIEDFLREKENLLITAIHKAEESELLGIPLEQLKESFVKKHTIDYANLSRDRVETAIKKRKLEPRDAHPGYFPIRGMQPFEVDVATYLVPYTGNRSLFNIKPTTYSSRPPVVQELSSSHLLIEIFSSLGNFIGNEVEEANIKNRYEKEVSDIEQWIAQINKELLEYNNTLESKVQYQLTTRIEEIQRRKKSENNIKP